MEALHALEVLAVDVGLSEVEVFERLHDSVDVGSKDRRGQTVFAVVGEGYGFFVVVERQDGDDGSEYLFLHDFRILLGSDEDSRLKEIAFAIVGGARTAGKYLSAGSYGAFDHLVYLCLLRLVYLRTVNGIGSKRVAIFNRFKRCRQLVEELVIDAFVNISPFCTVTYLSAIDDAGIEDAFDGEVYIGVSKDYGGRFASKFERDFCNVLS